MEDALPPWSQPDLLPAKPEDNSYGYVFRSVFTPCSREVLVERCREFAGSQSMLVWTPESQRVAPAVEFPFLHEAIRERTRKSIVGSLKIGGLYLVLFGLPTLMARDRRTVEYQFLLLLSFAILPLAEGWWQLRQLRQDTPEAMAARSFSARYGVWLDRQPTKVIWVLVAVLVAVFVLQLVHGLGDSVQLAGLTKTGLHPADAWRFLTAALMHGGVMHILMNGLVLFFLGKVVEALLGAEALALIFVASALGGSVFSFVLTPQTSVGASGGIMGLVGCLGVLGMHFWRILPPKFGRQMIYAVVFTGLTGLAARDVIDNAAHAGGVFVGAGLGWMLVRSHSVLPLQIPVLARWAGWGAFGLVIVAAAVITVRLWPQ